MTHQASQVIVDEIAVQVIAKRVLEPLFRTPAKMDEKEIGKLTLIIDRTFRRLLKEALIRLMEIIRDHSKPGRDGGQTLNQVLLLQKVQEYLIERSPFDREEFPLFDGGEFPFLP